MTRLAITVADIASAAEQHGLIGVNIHQHDDGTWVCHTRRRNTGGWVCGRRSMDVSKAVASALDLKAKDDDSWEDLI